MTDKMTKALENFDTAQSKASAAQTARDAAVAEYVRNPSDATSDAARTAMRSVDDAQRDLELATALRDAVVSEARAAELAAVRAELAKREAAFNPIDMLTDSDRELAVEIGLLSDRLHSSLVAKQSAIFAEHDAINELRRRTGIPMSNRPSDQTDAAARECARLAWAAQSGSDWKSGVGFFVPPMFAASVAGGTSWNDVRQNVGELADALVARVEARRSAPAKASKTGAVVAKVAATTGVLAMLGTLLAGG
ncbi:hypothetical protein AKJ09_08993 [Labilithrix luteola]|uniref:Uncharacterized protein n=1 Tax=Labilithrix luteola TaxID=1391654 RepID=A0A0K1QA95_9BACT|nr:hypothetical protein [Labilithrix luteola]AKV02330.1 hypothetical protein AKJ09_08993 [Labilithrix luteola]